MDLARAAADPRTLAYALMEQGQVRFSDTEDTERLRAIVSEGCEAALRSGDDWTISALFNQAGEVERSAGDEEAALRWYDQALAFARRSGEGHAIRMYLMNSAHMYLARGELALGRSQFEESLAISRALGDEWADACANVNERTATGERSRHVDQGLIP